MTETVDTLTDPKAEKEISPTEEEHRAVTKFSQAKSKRFESTTILREELSDKVYIFNIWWSISVFTILLLSGFDFVPFQLSDKVLISIIGTALVNVIGLIAIILKGLFNS